MKTFLKYLVSIILFVAGLIYCDSLAVVVVIGAALFYIWDEPKKETKKEGQGYDN